MRNIYRIALVSVLAFSLAAAPSELFAQARRSTTTSTSRTTSSSDNKSAATTAAPARNASTGNNASRSTAAQTSRSTSAQTSRSTSAQTSRSASSSASASRSTGSTSRSTSASSGSTAKRQVNTGSGSSSTSRSTTGTSARNTASGSTATTSTSRSTAATPSRSTATAPSRTVTPARQTDTEAPGTQNVTPARVTRSNATSSKGLTSAPARVDAERSAQASATAGSANKAARENQPQLNYSGARNGSMRMDGNRNLNRIPPRERDFMTYDKPGSFFAPAPHFFGYRVQTLPPRYRRITHWGIDYYYYDNIYYRRYGTIYVVCRPPFGVAIDIALRDLTFASVRFAYYHNVYRTFDVIDDNYRTIAEQNRVIAQNNARIASQNASLALNSGRAASAYEIAHALGLVQSYANLDTEYFYQDGVFYVVNGKNRYEVIVPPAGALVNELPDDYDTIVLNGVEYYKVDDTVYRLVLVDGVPALEVLGQMYGNMARQYNYYYN